MQLAKGICHISLHKQNTAWFILSSFNNTRTESVIHFN